MITRNAPTIYFLGRDVMPRGPEFDMADSFASYLGVELEVIKKNSIQAVISALKNKEGHIAAAGLNQTKSRPAEFMFGPSYQDITQQVVCRRDNVQRIREYHHIIENELEQKMAKYRECLSFS